METSEPEPWEGLYAAAVLETDPSKVADRITVAQNALRERWQTLHHMPLARDHERRRVEDAIRTLNMIRATELEAPP